MSTTETMAEPWAPSGGVPTQYSRGDLPPVDEREMTNWPLEPVTLDVPFDDSYLVAGTLYPPRPASARARRLDIMERLSRGDFRDFVRNPYSVRVQSNYFAVVANTMARLVLTGLDPAERELHRELFNAVVDMVRYGLAYVTAVNGELNVIDTRHCWNDADGESLWTVEPFASLDSRSGTLDAATVTLIEPDGSGQQFVQGLERGRWTGDRSGITEVEAAWAPAFMHPTEDNWGSIGYLQLIPLVVNLALLYSQSAGTVIRHEAPIKILPWSESQAAEAFGLDGDPATLDEYGRRRIQAAAQAALQDRSAIFTGSGRQRPEVIGGDLRTEASQAMWNALKAELRVHTAIPAALEQEGGDVPSGAAFRQSHAFLFMLGDDIATEVRTAAEQVLGRDVALDSPLTDTPTPDSMTDADRVGEQGSDGGSNGGGNEVMVFDEEGNRI